MIEVETYDPTAGDLAESTAAIRREWSDIERGRRRADSAKADRTDRLDGFRWVLKLPDRDVDDCLPGPA